LVSGTIQCLTRTLLSTADSGDATNAAVPKLRRAHHAPTFCKITMVEGESEFEAHENPIELQKFERLCFVHVGLIRTISMVSLNLGIPPSRHRAKP
jgi:hypothetical protein